MRLVTKFRPTAAAKDLLSLIPVDKVPAFRMIQRSGDAEPYRGARPLPVVQALRGLHFTTASTQFNTMLAVDNCRTL